MVDFVYSFSEFEGILFHYRLLGHTRRRLLTWEDELSL